MTFFGLACLLVGSAALGQTSGPQGIPGERVSHERVPARVRYAEGTVSVQRALAGETSDALVNLPLEPGDRLWTDVDGRAELVLPDGSVLWVNQRTTIDIVALGTDGERAILRLWDGNLILRRQIPVQGSLSELRIDTDSATTLFPREGLFRIDVEPDHRVWLSVLRGGARMTAGGLTEILAAGDRTFAEPTTAPAELMSFNTAEQDEFALWQGDRLANLVATARYVGQRDYMPPTVAANAAELETNGAWFYHADFEAWAWRPTGLSIGWSPYRDGRWVYGYGGWSWVSYAPWGWTTTHYGRWHHLPAYGWVWFPGYSYSPAWVSWYVGGGHVGWCPTGYYSRPFISASLWLGGGHGYGRGYHGLHNYDDSSQGLARGTVVAGRGYTRDPAATPQGWTFVRGDQLGHGAISVVSRTTVVRAAGGGSVSFDGPLRPRDPSALVAGGRIVARDKATNALARLGDREPRVAVPRAGTTKTPAPATRLGRAGISHPRPIPAAVTRLARQPIPTSRVAVTHSARQPVATSRVRAVAPPVMVSLRPRSVPRPYRPAVIRPRSSGQIPVRVAPKGSSGPLPRNVTLRPPAVGTHGTPSGGGTRPVSPPRVSIPRSPGGSRGPGVSIPSRSTIGRPSVGRPRTGTSTKSTSTRGARPRSRKSS